MTVDLEALLSGQVFAFMMIFARIGTAFMLVPGIGEPYVPMRSRLLLALGVTLLLLPVLSPQIPQLPEQIGSLVRLLFIEITIGLFFGTILRFLLSALELAGTFVSFQIGLSNATLFNPAFATQGTLPGALLSSVGVLLLFYSGFGDMILGGMVGTYDVFKPGVMPVFEDMSDTIAHLLPKAFAIGTQMAIPFFLIGILMYVPIGIMNRLMPQLQVLFVAMPLQIGVGLALFGMTISTMMLFWLQQFGESLHGLTQR
ncbi:MAG: flagellar biosynthetic protein FliR [Alphaproteobacteria bacterium]